MRIVYFSITHNVLCKYNVFLNFIVYEQAEINDHYKCFGNSRVVCC